MEQPTVIFETVHGSTAYGLARAGSDVDLKGVVIGPPAWYFGWAGGPEQIDLSADHVRYDIRKFFRLAVDANPTVLELLWTRDQDHRIVTDAGRRLIEVRLQRMALEILTTGAVNVFRPDREELLAIRDGAWPIDELEARAADLAAQIEEAVTRSPLPASPDEAALGRLCVELVAEHLAR